MLEPTDSFNTGSIGEVAEWSKAAVLKTADRASGPGGRIPPSPPLGNKAGHASFCRSCDVSSDQRSQQVVFRSHNPDLALRNFDARGKCDLSPVIRSRRFLPSFITTLDRYQGEDQDLNPFHTDLMVSAVVWSQLKSLAFQFAGVAGSSNFIRMFVALYSFTIPFLFKVATPQLIRIRSLSLLAPRTLIASSLHTA